MHKKKLQEIDMLDPFKIKTDNEKNLGAQEPKRPTDYKKNMVCL